MATNHTQVAKLPDDDPYWQMTAPRKRRVRIDWCDECAVDGKSQNQTVWSLRDRFDIGRALAYKDYKQWSEESYQGLSKRKRNQAVVSRSLSKALGMARRANRPDWMVGAAMAQAKLLRLEFTDEETLGDEDVRAQFVAALIAQVQQFSDDEREEMLTALKQEQARRESMPVAAVLNFPPS